MKTGIRMKIFIPVLVVLIFFPIASFLVFRATSAHFLTALSAKDLNGLVTETDTILHEIQAEAGENPELAWSDQVRELLRKIKTHLRSGAQQSDMLIYNSNKKLVYPKRDDLSETVADLSATCLELFNNAGWDAAQVGKEPISVGEKQYFIHLTETPGEGRLRAKYLVAYVPIPDYSVMLTAVGYLVLIITAGLAALSLAVVWGIAGNLQKPLKQLCGHLGEIEQNHFGRLEQEFTVRELEELRNSVNHMEERLKNAGQLQQAFFQNVSHDLRTPLMSICGYAQGIRQGIFPDEQKAAEIIAQESIRLKKMVDGILTLTKLDDGNLEICPCIICLNDFIEEGIEKTRGVEQLEKVQVVFEKPSAEIMVSADAGLLSAGFQNILANGLAHGEKLVTVTLTLEEGFAVVRTIDDGSGIAGEDLPHIFERFYKGRNGKFGIGLSIAAASMSRMGGRITAENREGGACFTLYLPAIK